MSCNDKISNLYLSRVNAKGIDYEGELSDSTKITENCVNQHEVNEDVYLLVDEIKEELSTEDLGSLSIEYDSDSFKDTIKQYEIEIDQLKTKIEELESKNYCDISITDCGIDFGDLSDDCDNPITTLGEALKVLFQQNNI